MRNLRRVLATLAALAAVVLYSPTPARAQHDGPALRGRVTSMQEGAMEGVLVGAKKSGSTITVVVVSDAEGVYQFPRERLTPGQYALSIWATGYQLSKLASVDVGVDATREVDLELRAADDLAAQLSNTEWLLSIPGPGSDRRRHGDRGDQSSGCRRGRPCRRPSWRFCCHSRWRRSLPLSGRGRCMPSGTMSLRRSRRRSVASACWRCSGGLVAATACARSCGATRSPNYAVRPSSSSVSRRPGRPCAPQVRPRGTI